MVASERRLGRIDTDGIKYVQSTSAALLYTLLPMERGGRGYVELYVNEISVCLYGGGSSTLYIRANHSLFGRVTDEA